MPSAKSPGKSKLKLAAGEARRRASAKSPQSVSHGSRSLELDRSGGGPFSNHDINLIVLKRGIENLLDDGAEPVDFINEQNIITFEIGQERCEITGPLKYRARGLSKIYAKLAGKNMG